MCQLSSSNSCVTKIFRRWYTTSHKILSISNKRPDDESLIFNIVTCSHYSDRHFSCCIRDRRSVCYCCSCLAVPDDCHRRRKWVDAGRHNGPLLRMWHRRCNPNNHGRNNRHIGRCRVSRWFLVDCRSWCGFVRRGIRRTVITRSSSGIRRAAAFSMSVVSKWRNIHDKVYASNVPIALVRINFTFIWPIVYFYFIKKLRRYSK